MYAGRELAHLFHPQPDGKNPAMCNRVCRRSLLPVLALLLGACSWRTAAADPITVYSSPGAVQPDENVLYHGSGTVSQGTTVTGATNNTGFLVDITSNDSPQVTLQSFGNGQARVQNSLFSNQNPAGFSSIVISPNSANSNFGFTEVEFNVNVLNGTSGVLQLDFEGQGFTAFSTTVDMNGDPLDLGNGENFFGITADSGSFITSLTLTALVNGQPSPIIQDLRQLRVSGLVNNPGGGPPGPGTVPSVPEPASLLLWVLLGGAAIGAVVHRRVSARRPARAAR